MTFSFSKNGETIELGPKKAILGLLDPPPRGEGLNDKEVHDLSHNIAVMNENVLFDMKQRPVVSTQGTT